MKIKPKIKKIVAGEKNAGRTFIFLFLFFSHIGVKALVVTGIVGIFSPPLRGNDRFFTYVMQSHSPRTL